MMSERCLEDVLKQRQRLKAKICELSNEVTRCDDQLKQQLKDLHADELTFAGWVISWKEVETSTVDVKALRDEMPEIAEQYSTTSRTKRYSVRLAS